MERPRVASPEKFRSPEDEIAYLREKVAEKERELEAAPNRFEKDRIAKREIAEYAEHPPATILHEAIVMPEHDIVHNILKLEPEAHDAQIDGLLKIVQERGIRNALSVVARMKNPHLEDDLHRVLVRYIAEGLPDKGLGVPEKVQRALHLALFEIEPQAHGEGSKEEARQQKLELVLSSSEQLYAGLMSLIAKDEGFSLEIAVPEGSEEATLYLAVPGEKKTIAERLISSVFPNARISEQRGDYNIFSYEGENAAAYAMLAENSAYPLKTPDLFEHDPMNILLAAFAKIAKHGEGAALQIVVGNAGDRYNHHYKKMIEELGKGKTLHAGAERSGNELGQVTHEAFKSIFLPKSQEEKEKEMRRSADQVASEEIGRKIKSRVAPDDHPPRRIRPQQKTRRRPALQFDLTFQSVRRPEGQPPRLQACRELGARTNSCENSRPRIHRKLRDAAFAWRDNLDLPFHGRARHDIARAQEIVRETGPRASRDVAGGNHDRHQSIRGDGNAREIRASRPFAPRVCHRADGHRQDGPHQEHDHSGHQKRRRRGVHRPARQ